MNNNIEENYVNFENAKLIKEKGFDCKCIDCYNTHGNLYSNGWCEYLDDRGVEHPFNNEDFKLVDLHYILRPTTALSIKWIKENFGINISIHMDYKGIFWAQIHKKNDKIIPKWEAVAGIHNEYKTHEEAENAAIKYTLTNLI